MHNKSQVLTNNQILQKIKRIAYEITEDNFYDDSVVLVGIVDTGYKLAELLQSEIQQIKHLNVELESLALNKKKPLQSEIELSQPDAFFEKKIVILVDDVFNSGRTMAYSLKPFLNVRIKKLQTAVLIDRDHKNFPIKADYVGYALSTTLKEHISVDLSRKNNYAVYLN